MQYAEYVEGLEDEVNEDIRNEKQDIGIQKQDIDLPSELTNKTKQHLQLLH